jgi:iron transport multicopper oxidase
MAPQDSFLLANAGESNASFSKIFGAQTHAIALNHMDNVEVTIFNWDAGLHPFHVRLSTMLTFIGRN